MEIVAHDALVDDVTAKIVAVVGQMTSAVAVKALARNDDVAEKYVTFVARIVGSFEV